MGTPTTYSYDKDKVICTISPIPLSGLGAVTLSDLIGDGTVDVTWDSDIWLETKNAAGGGTRSLSKDRAATIKFTVPNESPVNKILDALRIADSTPPLAGSVTVAFMIREVINNKDTVFADQCWIKKIPDFQRAVQAQGTTWELRTLNCVKY